MGIAAWLAAGVDVGIEIGRAFGIDVGMSFGLAGVAEFTLVVGRRASATPAIRLRLTRTKIAFGLVGTPYAEGPVSGPADRQLDDSAMFPQV